jgi:small conductance mechanosensitive channel
MSNLKQAPLNTSKGSQATASTQQPNYLDQVLNSEYVGYVWKVGLAVVVFFVLFMVAKRIAGIASRKFYEHASVTDLNKQESTGQLIYDVVFYILLIITIFISFEIVGFDVGVILGGISFGVWFAFKEILGNMIAWVMILNIKELKLGDIIEIDGKPGYFGKIEEITIRYTIIRTLDLRQVVIPNMELITNPIKTYSSEELIKLNTTIPVRYEQDLDQAMKVMIDAANSLDIVRQKDSSKAYVMEYGDAGVEIKIFFRVDPNCGLPMDYIIWDVNAAIITAFRKEGIKMPYKHIVATMDENDQDILSNIRSAKA